MTASDWVALAAGFGGALLGAIVGGVIAWLIAARERHERRKAGAYRVQLKVNRMLSDVSNIKDAIEQDIQKADSHGLKNEETWTKVTPIMGAFKPIAVDLEDLIWLIEAKEYGIYDDIVQFEMRHTAVCQAVDQYGVLRSEFRDLIPTQGGTGSLLHTGLTKEIYDRVRVRMLEMNTLIESLIPLLGEYIVSGRSLVRRIGPAARKSLDDDSFPLMRVQGDA